MPSGPRVCAWIAAVGLVVPCTGAAQDRTEQDVIEAIVRDGPRARAIRMETEVVRREQRARLAYPNPGLTYSREGAGFTEFLQLEQLLPIFGTRAALSRAGVAAITAAEAERDARLCALRTDASAAVARLTAAHARFEAAQAHTAEVQRLMAILRTREREGEGSRFDRLRGEQELREAKVLATSAAIDVAAARASLVAMLPPDVDVGRIVPVSGAGAPPLTLNTLMARASASRAELRALQASADRAGLEADAARRAHFPTPSLFGGLKRADEDTGRQRGAVLGFSMSLPLFDRGGRDAARWTAERTRAEAERGSIEQQIRGEVTRALEALTIRQTAMADDADAAGDELMRTAEVAYREGEMGILELLDAVRTASRARMRSIDVRLEARLAQIALERAVGDVLWP